MLVYQRVLFDGVFWKQAVDIYHVHILTTTYHDHGLNERRPAMRWAHLRTSTNALWPWPWFAAGQPWRRATKRRWPWVATAPSHLRITQTNLTSMTSRFNNWLYHTFVRLAGGTPATNMDWSCNKVANQPADKGYSTTTKVCFCDSFAYTLLSIWSLKYEKKHQQQASWTKNTFPGKP